MLSNGNIFGLFFLTEGPHWSFVFFFFMASRTLMQQVIYHSMAQVQEQGPKLDLNQSLYSMAQSESEYDQAEAVASLSLPPER